MNVMNINKYFNRYTFNDETGDLTLYSADNTESKTIKIFEEFRIGECTGRFPEIYTELYNSAINGSFAFLDNGSRVYYRQDGKWNLVYATELNDIFRINYYDDQENYMIDSLVGYKYKKYVSMVDGPTTVPDNKIIKFINVDNRVIESVDLSNIIGLHLINDTLILTTNGGMYSYVDNKISNIVDRQFQSKAVQCSGEIVYFSGDTVITIEKLGISRSISLPGIIADITTDGSNVYAAVPSEGKIYSINILNEEISLLLDIGVRLDDKINIDNSTVTLYSKTNGEIRFYDLQTDETYNSLVYSDIDSIVSNKNGDVFALTDQGKVVSWNYISSEWKEMSVSEMFISSECPNSFEEDALVYLNSTSATRNKYVHGYNPDINDFCFIGNRYVLSSNTRNVFKTSIMNGVMNPVYTGQSITIGSNISGVTFFESNILIATEQKIIVADLDTMQIIREVDLQTKIEDSRILAITSKADTVYIMTTNGKIYMFSGIDAPPSGIVVLAMYTHNSKIAIEDGDNIFVSYTTGSDTSIWKMSLINGSIVERTFIDRGINVAIDTVYGDIYSIDLYGTGRMIKYKKEIR